MFLSDYGKSDNKKRTSRILVCRLSATSERQNIIVRLGGQSWVQEARLFPSDSPFPVSMSVRLCPAQPILTGQTISKWVGLWSICHCLKSILFQRMFGSCLGWGRDESSSSSIAVVSKTLEFTAGIFEVLSFAATSPSPSSIATGIFKVLKYVASIFKTLEYRPSTFEDLRSVGSFSDSIVASGVV